MRTTVTLSPEAEALLKRSMADHRLTFKEAVNSAIVAGLAPRAAQAFRTRTFDMGAPMVPIDHALRLAGELEDDELIRKLAAGR
jgi:hypothetical protein